MEDDMAADIPIRPLGATWMMVSALGLGGYHIGRMQRASEAVRLVQAAIDAGITFMDNAWEYHEGRSETLMGQAIADRREQLDHCIRFVVPDRPVIVGALHDRGR